MGMKQLRIIGKSNYSKKMKLILIPTTQHGSDFFFWIFVGFVGVRIQDLKSLA